MRVYDYRSSDGTVTKVTIEVSHYSEGGALAVILNCADGSGVYAVATVNIPDWLPNSPYSYLDTNNLGDDIVGFMSGNGFGELDEGGACAPSGYCWYPLFRFDMEALEEAME